MIDRWDVPSGPLGVRRLREEGEEGEEKGDERNHFKGWPAVPKAKGVERYLELEWNDLGGELLAETAITEEGLFWESAAARSGSFIASVKPVLHLGVFDKTRTEMFTGFQTEGRTIEGQIGFTENQLRRQILTGMKDGEVPSEGDRIRRFIDALAGFEGILVIRKALVMGSPSSKVKPVIEFPQVAARLSTPEVFSALPTLWLGRSASVRAVVIADAAEIVTHLTGASYFPGRFGKDVSVSATPTQVDEIVFHMSDVLFLGFENPEEVDNYLPHKFVVFEEDPVPGVLEELFMVQKEEIEGKAKGRTTETW